MAYKSLFNDSYRGHLCNYIHHSHIDHNLRTLFTPKILQFVFSFSQIFQSSHKREMLNIEKNVYAKFWGL